MALLSSRTRWIMLVTIVLSVALGTVFHHRQALCPEVPHGFERRAPIRGASGRDTFVCHAMVEHLPTDDIVLGVAWWLALIVLVRSVRVDAHTRRMHYMRLE